MLAYNEIVFDENISGNGTSWYTSCAFDSLIATADVMRLVGLVTQVAGSSPTLSISVDESADGQNWVLGSALITKTPVVNNDVVTAQYVTESLGLVRIRLAMTGTTPSCRIRLGITGRAY